MNKIGAANSQTRTNSDLVINRKKEKEQHQEWIANGVFVIYTHLAGLAALLFYHPPVWMWTLTFILWMISGLGITMGYHRLWSHATYRATWPLRLVLALAGTMGFQGSIKWWSQRHRLHHRYTDTDNDPYNAKYGFWFSHIGWIFKKPYYPRMSLVDVSDLTSDPIVKFQHKYYVPLALGCGFILPMFLARLICDDVLGGFFFVGHVSKLMIWHTTFMINSFAHLIGSQNYSLDYTARGNLILAILTHGEGHHNYHHQFPKDYRNGIHWLDYDPTKWLIKFFSMLGLAYGLVETPSIEIEKALILTAEEKLRSRREKIEWGPNSDELPIWTREQVKKMSEDGRRLLIIDNLVYDVAKFMSKHPGGAKLLLMFNGADASEAFNGIYNLHSTAAQTLARTFLVARIEN